MRFAILAIVVLSGCASHGTGRYMQYMNNGQVVAEYEGVTGIKPCTLEAHEIKQANPKANIRCSMDSANLQYGFVVQNTLNMEHGFRQSSPYRVSAESTWRCENLLKSFRAKSNIKILSTRCS